MRRIALALLTAILFTPHPAWAQGTEMFRPPAAAGTFYPEDGATLLTAVRRYLAAAEVPERPGRLAAVVAPHSAYGFSGDVAAHAFKELQPGQYDRVIILAPSHFAPIEGCSIPQVDAYTTPLGPVPLDTEAIRKLAYSSLISVRRLHYNPRAERRPTHEREHAIEVLLPFLQERLGQFALVPMLVGELADTDSSHRDERVTVVAEAIRDVMDERTLLVVSTDFTHYGTAYHYTPFETMDDVPTAIRGLDRKAFELLLKRDTEEFRVFLDRTGATICGKDALLVLMKLLPASARGEVTAYLTSGERTGRSDQSVSYAAIRFHDPRTPPPAQRPVRQFLPTQEQLEAELQRRRDREETVTPQPLVPIPEADGE